MVLPGPLSGFREAWETEIGGEGKVEWESGMGKGKNGMGKIGRGLGKRMIREERWK